MTECCQSQTIIESAQYSWPKMAFHFTWRTDNISVLMKSSLRQPDRSLFAVEQKQWSELEERDTGGREKCRGEGSDIQEKREER